MHEACLKSARIVLHEACMHEAEPDRAGVLPFCHIIEAECMHVVHVFLCVVFLHVVQLALVCMCARARVCVCKPLT